MTFDKWAEEVSRGGSVECETKSTAPRKIEELFDEDCEEES